MKLQRTTMMAQYPHVGTKDFYAATDVDALLARIRQAVDAERGAGGTNHQCDCPFGWCDGRCPFATARAALDALLSGEG